ncbi:MAG TPA: hypothetical protein VM534_00595, partial [Thermoanaerobaculia bacterium]|nr:hypothetical protein [Thermoanaerobaculia bacterium]
TSLDISYRYIEQPPAGDLPAENERLLLRMGQSLRLPIDMRVLLGIDVARFSDSALTDGHLAAGDPLHTRVVGGVSFAF